MTGGDMSVVAGRLGVAGFVVRRGFPMVLGRLLVMIGGMGVMFMRVVGRRHR